MSTEKKLVMLVQFENLKSVGDYNNYATVKAYVQYEKDYLKDYWTVCYEGDGDLGIGGIKAGCQTHASALVDHGNDYAYAYGVEWAPGHGGYCLENMEVGVKALRGVAKKLARFNEEDGYAKSVGQYFLRVAKACGFKEMVFRAKDRWIEPGAPYKSDRYFPQDEYCSGYPYRATTLVMGMEQIDWQVRQWHAFAVDNSPKKLADAI